MRPLIALIALLAAAGPVDAGQKTRTPRAGEEVVVKQTSSGEELRGRLVELSSESLSILVDSQRVTLPLDRVLRVDATRDSVANGAAIGAVVLGGWCALICGQGLDSGGSLTGAVLVNAGLGALIGAGIDARIKGRVPIYIKSSGKSGSALQVRIAF